MLAALARLEGKFDERFERLETGQTRLRVDLMGRMDRLREQVQAMDLFRKLDSRVRQLEEKR